MKIHLPAFSMTHLLSKISIDMRRVSHYRNQGTILKTKPDHKKFP
jgi:hypothetical protein